MGINRFRVVGIFIANFFHFFVYEEFKQRVQKQKVGDPTS